MTKLFLGFFFWGQMSLAQQMTVWDVADSSTDVTVKCENGNVPNFDSASLISITNVELDRDIENVLYINYMRGGIDMQMQSQLVQVGKESFMVLPQTTYDEDHPYFFISITNENSIGLHFSDKTQETCGGGMLSFLISKI